MQTVSLRRSSQSSGSSKIYFSATRPVSSYDAVDVPVEFAFPESGNEYLDLRRSRVYFKLKMTKLDGTALANLEKKRGSSTYSYSPCFLRSTNTSTENVSLISPTITRGRLI